MKKLLLFAVLFCGCAESKLDYDYRIKQENLSHNIKYIDYRVGNAGSAHIMEYEGNKYIVLISNRGSCAVCPALPAKAEK